MERRRLPLGAEVRRDGVDFRVWAPGRRLEVVLEGSGAATPLEPEADGYHAGRVASARAGTRYRYRIDGGALFPDPASRFQPDGPHGPSEVIDPATYAWKSTRWRGAGLKGQIIYELHVGTFTQEGTFAAACAELPRLSALGVTLLEILPIAEFAGTFGWGYDGVDLFAPSRLYGRPDDLRRFIDEAHAVGLGVILDVVYNHFGPDGCYVQEFSPHYFSESHVTDWGKAINFDGPRSGPVRAFFTSNAGYWIDEYRFDGLRLDATQSIHDESPEHVLVAIAARARAAAGERSIVLVAENEPQDANLARAIDKGGYGLDALWNDDYHHTAFVAATGHGDAYYSDTTGSAQQLLAAVKWGFLFQGQRYAWQEKGRGAPALDLPSSAFVTFLENHDQVANAVHGARLWQRTSPGVYRALVALTLLAPQTPMLFQGEEFGSSAPFLYFAEHADPKLAALVRDGRAEFLRQFPSLANEAARAALHDPGARSTFTRCKLDSAEAARKPHIVALYRDLLRLRRETPAFAQQRGDLVHGTVIGERTFALRFLCPEGDRLVVINLGASLRLGSIGDPIVAPPAGAGPHWETVWSSDDIAYAGDGIGPVDGPDGWRLGGQETVVLAPAPAVTGARSGHGDRKRGKS